MILSVIFKNANRLPVNRLQKRNLAFKAMQGLFSCTQKLFIYADGEREIIDAILPLANSAWLKEIVLVAATKPIKYRFF